MNIRKSLETIALLTATACAGSHDKAPITAPQPITPITLISPVGDTLRGYNSDTVRVIATGPATMKLLRNSAPFDSGASINRLLAFGNQNDTYTLQTPNATKSFTLQNFAEPSPIIDAPQTIVEDSIGGAHVKASVSLPSNTTSSTFAIDGVVQAVPTILKTFFLTSNADPNKTQSHTLTLAATIAGYNGQAHTLPTKTAQVVVQAAVPQDVDGINYAIAGQASVSRFVLKPGTGSPGTTSLRVKDGTITYDAVNGVVLISKNPVTKVDSALTFEAIAVHDPTGRIVTTTKSANNYLPPAVQATRSPPGYTIDLRSPSPTFKDVVADYNLPIEVFTRTNAGVVIRVDTLTKQQRTKTFPSVTQADSIYYNVPLSGGALKNGKPYITFTNTITTKP